MRTHSHMQTLVVYSPTQVALRNLPFFLHEVLDLVSLSQVCFAMFPMDKNIEHRIGLKFYIANGI